MCVCNVLQLFTMFCVASWLAVDSLARVERSWWINVWPLYCFISLVFKDNFQKHFTQVRELVKFKSHSTNYTDERNVEMKLQMETKLFFRMKGKTFWTSAFGCPQCKRCKIVQRHWSRLESDNMEEKCSRHEVFRWNTKLFSTLNFN